MKWLSYKTTLVKPNIFTHYLKSVAVGDDIYVFGSINDTNRPLCKIFKLKTEDLELSEFITVPKGNVHFDYRRYLNVRHMVNAYNEFILIYIGGGAEDPRVLLRISTVTKEMEEVLTNWPVPDITSMFSSCVVNNSMYLFGCKIDMPRVYALDLQYLSWTMIDVDAETGHGGLAGCSTAVYGNYIYVFGGSDITGHRLNALSKLDTVTKTWTSIKGTGKVPSPRGGHTAVVANDKMFVIGGMGDHLLDHQYDVSILNLKTNEWVSSVKFPETLPHSPRPYFCSVIGNQMFVFVNSSELIFSHIKSNYVNYVIHILDFLPSLKSMCEMTVMNCGLSTIALPKTIQKQLQNIYVTNS
ncbi:hypothetical protein CHUAL_006454 [Chamberlinius hualienensis]